MKILHVEDDTMIHKSLSRGLQAAGHTFEWAARMEEVPADLTRFDLVITDMSFPGGNGMLVVQRAASQNVPCLVFSGDHRRQQEVETAGARFVCKPETAELIKLVGSL